MTRLQEHYKDVVKPELVSAFSYGNPMEVPKVEKVVINMGVGEAAADSKKNRCCGERDVADRWSKGR